MKGKPADEIVHPLRELPRRDRLSMKRARHRTALYGLPSKTARSSDSAVDEPAGATAAEAADNDEPYGCRR